MLEMEEVSNVDMQASLVEPLVTSVVFTVVGLILFGAALWLMARVAPFSVRKEIEVDQNVALSVIMGSVILGIAIILAASMIDTGGGPAATAPVSSSSAQ